MSDIMQTQQNNTGINNNIMNPIKEDDLKFLNDLKKFLEKHNRTLDNLDLSSIISNIKIKAMKSNFEYYEHKNDKFELLNGKVENGEGWILVFPYGKHYFEKYKEYVTFDEKFFKQVADNFETKVCGEPFIDKEHEYAESYGEIIDYKWDKGGMYFHIRLNELGKELVKGKVFKYISPAFGDVTDLNGVKHNNVLYAISLVNYPALMNAIPDLQSQIKLKNTQEVNNNMGKLNINILELSKVKNDKTSKYLDKVLSNSSIELQDGNGVMVAQEVVDNLIGLVMQLQETVATLTQDNAEAQTAVNSANEEMTKLKNTVLSAEAETFVDEQIKLGKMMPVLRDFELKNYLKDKEGIIARYNLMPENVDVQLTRQSSASDNYELTKEDREIAENSGYDLDDPKQKKEFIKIIGGK